MDLWDLTKLLLRRWYIAGPLLLVSLVSVVVTAQGVQPDYKATGHLLMIPAPGSTSPAEPAKSRPHNPFVDLGYATLGNAATLKVVGDSTALASLRAAGYSDSVTILMAESTPLLNIEAVASSPALATATVQEVIRRLNADIAAEQARYNVAKEDTITTLTLGDGSTVEVVTSKVKRVLIVAAAVGLLVTVAGTTALDALLRRAARRRSGFDGPDPRPSAGPPSPPPPPPFGRVLSPAGAIESASSSIHVARSPSTTDLGSPTGFIRPEPADDSVFPQHDGNGSADSPEGGPEKLDVPPDATIVLPLQLSFRDDGKQRR